ncbi:MAG: putative solute-binding protein [Myxococcota bacterium]|nr:putative solute-binding protein [Myxococcota bacterium]
MARMLLILLALLFVHTEAVAGASARNLCVFDPSGANGDAFQMLRDYRTAAAGWGVQFKLKPYTDEKTASEDFKAGKCDAVVLTGPRVRSFQPFTGTIEAMGAIPTYSHLKRVVRSLANPKAAKLMKTGAFETAAIFPGGSILLFVNDRTINTVEKLAGKRLAVLEYDTASKVMAKHVGASMVGADLGTFAGMFNNKNVALCYAPATAYQALELHKGIGKNGGVIRFPLAQVTFQVLTRAENFSDVFMKSSRSWAAQNFDRFLKLSMQAESTIPKSTWIEIPANDQARYEKMFQETRLRLRDQEKVYDRKMLSLLRKVRCKVDRGRSECVSKLE